MPPSSSPSRLMASLRGLILVLVFLVSVELSLRVDDAVTWGVPLWGPYSEAWLTTRDSLGPHGRPGYRYQKWGMNSAGFRGPELGPTPPPLHIVRIAILGASETFGLYETEGAEYPARLRAVLDSIAPSQFEVVNAALPGLMVPTMIRYYTCVVAPIDPEIVFVYPSPSFYLSDPPPMADTTSPAACTGGHPNAGRASAHLDLRLPPKAREVLKQLVSPVVVTAYREWRLERLRRTHPPQWVWHGVPGDRMALFERQLDDLVRSIVSHGARVVLVTHTNRFVGLPAAEAAQHPRHLINLMAVYYPRASIRAMIEIDSVANAIVRRVAQNRGAAVVEAEGRIPASDVYFADYAHFTDAGADWMAHLLVPAVLAASPIAVAP